MENHRPYYDDDGDLGNDNDDIGLGISYESEQQQQEQQQQQQQVQSQQVQQVQHIPPPPPPAAAGVAIGIGVARSSQGNLKAGSFGTSGAAVGSGLGLGLGFGLASGIGSKISVSRHTLQRNKPKHTATTTATTTKPMSTPITTTVSVSTKPKPTSKPTKQKSSRSGRARSGSHGRKPIASSSQALLRARASSTCPSYAPAPVAQASASALARRSVSGPAAGSAGAGAGGTAPVVVPVASNDLNADSMGFARRSMPYSRTGIGGARSCASSSSSLSSLVKKPSNYYTKGEWKEVEVIREDTASNEGVDRVGVVIGVNGFGVDPPCERSLHASAVWKDQLFIFGGYDGDSRRNDFYSYNFTTKKWKLIDVDAHARDDIPLVNHDRGSPPTPRDRHCAVVHNNSFYIFGGFDGAARVNDFHRYDITYGTWSRILPNINAPTLPTPRHSHSAVVHNDTMYVFGGYDGSYRCDLFAYDFGTNVWTIVDVAGRIPRSRYRATFVAYNDGDAMSGSVGNSNCNKGPQLILHGGHDGTRHLSDTHVYDIEHAVWSPLVSTGVPPIHRDSHVCVIYNTRMYIMGGSAGGAAMNDLHELVLDGNSASASSGSLHAGADFVPEWRKVIVTGSTAHRFCHVGAMYEDSLYIFGGFNGSSRLNDFVRFEFNIDDLSYEVPPSTLVNDMLTFVNHEALSDITFIVEGRELFAHRIMLLRSPYFRAMLTGCMMESNLSTIHIEEIPYDIFLSVMQYLYTDSVDVHLESAMDLFAAADIYDIPRLQAMCEKKMLESIEVGNAASIFLAADIHSAQSLRSKALNYILKHFEVVSKSVAFEEMARSNVELVVEILRQR